jgi:hypothetical protein
MQLACGGRTLGAVGHAVDDHAACSADALAAVVVEGDRVGALLDQPLVDHVEHFEKRHIWANIFGRVADHLALGLAVLLAPDM